MTRPGRPRWFTAATWNLRYDVPADRQVSVLRRLKRQGVTVILLQEFQANGIVKAFRDEGWRVYREGTCGVAWLPSEWVLAANREAVFLSASTFPRVGGAIARPVAAAVTLVHSCGRTLDVLSYHMPAAVQRAGRPNEGAPARMRVLRESVATLGARARESKADAILFGGDDNVDEALGPGWRFMRRVSTGLRLVRPPRGTHGRRRIDDFRIKRLRVGKGWTRPTPGDHRVHVRRFRWRR